MKTTRSRSSTSGGDAEPSRGRGRPPKRRNLEAPGLSPSPIKRKSRSSSTPVAYAEPSSDSSENGGQEDDYAEAEVEVEVIAVEDDDDEEDEEEPAKKKRKTYKPRSKVGKMVLDVEFSTEAAAARTNEIQQADLDPNSTASQKWYAALERLKLFKQQHGHCNVPFRYPEDKALSSWVRTQRTRYGRQQMPDYRCKALEALGFEWRLKGDQQSQAVLGTANTNNAATNNAVAAAAMPNHVTTNNAAVATAARLASVATANPTNGSDAGGGQVEDAEKARSPKPRKPRVSTGQPRAPTAQAEAKWMFQYEKLCAFKETHGNTDVPLTYPEDQTFSNWVRMQRDKYNYPNRGVMSEDRIEKLEAIGFDWKSPKTSIAPKPFEEVLQDLRKWKDENENGDINSIPRKLSLGNWLQKQRDKYQDNDLDQFEIEQLEALGMDWNAKVAASQKPQKSFAEYMVELQAYKDSQGHINVGKNRRGLGQWLLKQKQLYHEQQLEADKIAQLEALGIDWSNMPPPKKSWEENLAVLVAYQITNGNTDVPPNYAPDPELSLWVKAQKEEYHAGKLDEMQINHLQALAFDFGPPPPKRKSWDEMLQDLTTYKETHGTTQVPDNYEEDPNLPKWANRQRALYEKQKLSMQQIQKLQAIDMDWTLPTKKGGSKWDEMYEKLQSYKEKYGDVNTVSSFFTEEPSLCHWVCRQRMLHSKEKLTPEQVEKLTEIGIDWEGPRRHKYSKDEVWQAHFEKLRAFQRDHGHCGIPTNFPDDLTLLEWIHGQHVAYLKKTMPQERIEKLESIGFVWRHDIDITDDDNQSIESDRKMPASSSSARGPRISWQKHYENLKSYKEEHGNYDVPAEFDAKLADWVRLQRRYFKRGKGLTEKKIELLNMIEFDWGGPDAPLNINSNTTTKMPAKSRTPVATVITAPTNSPLAMATAGSPGGAGTPRATLAAARLPTGGTGVATRPVATVGAPAAAAMPPSNNRGTMPPGPSTIAIAAAAAAAATRNYQADDRQHRHQIQADVNQVRMALNNMQVANQTLSRQLQESLAANQALAKKLQDSEQARKDDIVILRNSLRRHDDQLTAQQQLIQNQTTQITNLSQTVETLRQAHEYQLRQQQQREQQQNQHSYNFSYRL